MAGENRILEGRGAGCSHPHQYVSGWDGWFRKIDQLQRFMATEFLRSHCTHINSPFFVFLSNGISAVKPELPVSSSWLNDDLSPHAEGEVRQAVVAVRPRRRLRQTRSYDEPPRP